MHFALCIEEMLPGLALGSLPYTVQIHYSMWIVNLCIEEIQVTIAQGLHLFPFRTEKLNLVTPMVLRKRESR